MNYLDPNGQCISPFDVCHAYQMLESSYAAPDQDSDDDENVRFVYFSKVLDWKLPMEEQDRRVIDRLFAAEWLATAHPEYQGLGQGARSTPGAGPAPAA